MRIAVMGTGYVGLVAGACFAELGNQVTCIDVNAQKIAALNDGVIPIYEPGLDTLVARNARAGRLAFTIEAAEPLANAQVVFIAVGTPSDEDGSADLRYVCSVAETIGDHVQHAGVLVVCKSTVPIGTNHTVRDIIKTRTELPFHVVSNPEFLKEGAAVDDFMKPDRIVVGTDDAQAAAVMDRLYEPLVRTGAPIIHMDVSSAEMTKYAANAMLATRISFMNEIANLCAVTGADVRWVRKGIGTDARIGKHFLFPGVGYGGSCFPKDVRALLNTGRHNGLEMEIIAAAERVNAAQKQLLGRMVKRHFGEDLTGKRLAVWGLAFKARTDDMREAPSIVILNELTAAGAEVSAFDPEARLTAHREFGDSIRYADDLYDAVDGADALLIVTDWNVFRQPDFERVKQLMAGNPVVFDGRNLYDPASMRELGFAYYGVGRGRIAGDEPQKG